MNIPIPTKMGSKMGGAPTPKWDPIGFDPARHAGNQLVTLGFWTPSFLREVSASETMPLKLVWEALSYGGWQQKGWPRGQNMGCPLKPAKSGSLQTKKSRHTHTHLWCILPRAPLKKAHSYLWCIVPRDVRTLTFFQLRGVVRIKPPKVSHFFAGEQKATKIWFKPVHIKRWRKRAKVAWVCFEGYPLLWGCLKSKATPFMNWQHGSIFGLSQGT